eukprot:TRINITY_DN8948_c0_g2_i1.p1 TRINITY_DN8948_c0_g2~~TRINITY_DN8948_c0_g2_i1.p1  ORF type:complete len:627 (-),score=96.82 TRINITY_DN8948_c0_g2_i1:39-1919(-)
MKGDPKWHLDLHHTGGVGRSATTDYRFTVPRLQLLQRLRRRKRGLFCALAAFLEWCRSFLTLSGFANLLVLAAICVQVATLLMYLRNYLSHYSWFTLVVEVPLLLHILWFWREETASRAVPTQWLAYSWMHAAKVVVLYCKVMPRLPADSDSDMVSVGGFSMGGASFGDLYSATNLANVLLMTPAIYSLLMFRSGRAVFSSFSNKITVDLLMHFDMMWHVAIDMVDQVDMFNFARLAEWVGDNLLRKYARTLTLLQTITPFLLFLSIALHAQSMPGVVADRWCLPAGAASSGRPPAKSADTPSHSQRDRAESSQAAPPPPSAAVGRQSERASQTSQGSLQTPTLMRKPGPDSASPNVKYMRTERSESAAFASSPAAFSMHTQSRLGISEREIEQRDEKHRWRRLDGIVHQIQRQNIVIARKRSAVISIFFVDLPFLTVRIVIYILMLREGESYIPSMAVKNAICILLNILQYTLVRMVSADSYNDIQRRLANYYCNHPGSAGSSVSQSGTGGRKQSASAAAAARTSGQFPRSPDLDSITSSHDINMEVLTPATSPDIYRPSKMMSAAKLRDAERWVRRSTVRSPSVCVHFWALLVSFVLGFLLAKGEHFFSSMATFINQLWLVIAG